MATRASGDSNLDGDDGQPDAPIQQRIVSPSIPMIVADAAGNGGRVERGGGDKGERIVGAILREIVSQGFVISAASTLCLKRATATKFLQMYRGIVPEYREMVDQMCSGLVMVLEV